MATDNTARAILQHFMAMRQPFGSLFATYENLFRQIQLTPSGLLQKCGGPLGNCIHAAQRAPQWPPPGQALAQTRPHKFAHRPPIFCFRLLANDPADILTAAAAARSCHHKLSWASASCCVGSDGGQHVQQQQPPSLPPACNKLM